MAKSSTTMVPPAPKATAKPRARAKAPAAKRTTGFSQAVSHERIAQRAFQLWLDNGRPAGSEEANWLEAERQLQAEASSN